MSEINSCSFRPAANFFVDRQDGKDGEKIKKTVVDMSQAPSSCQRPQDDKFFPESMIFVTTGKIRSGKSVDSLPSMGPAEKKFWKEAHGSLSKAEKIFGSEKLTDEKLQKGNGYLAKASEAMGELHLRNLLTLGTQSRFDNAQKMEREAWNRMHPGPKDCSCSKTEPINSGEPAVYLVTEVKADCQRIENREVKECQ